MAVAHAGRIGLAVSAEDVTAYRRDGAVLIKGVLSGAELGLLERGLEHIHGTPSDMFSRFEAPGGCGETMVDQFPSLRSRFLRQLFEEAPVAELAARLMGVPSAQLILDQMFYKRKGRIVPTPWHQDTAFLRVRGHDMARVWLSCDPSPRDVTVQVVRGSHLWNVVYDTPGAASDVVKAGEGSGFTYNGIGNSELPAVPDIEGHRDSFDILGFDVEPGDAVVFQGNVLHGAAGRDNHPYARRAITTMWGGPELRYHEPSSHAIPLPGDTHGKPVPHGARIRDHTDAFPIFWREIGD
jgi:hypothetical protein